MSVFKNYGNGWMRVEGNPVPPSSLQEKYGSFVNMPNTTRIFYSISEINIYNPNSLIKGIVYKCVPLRHLGYDSIEEVDANYATFLQDVANYNKTVIIDDSENSAQLLHTDPFTINESCLILFDESDKTYFGHYDVLFVDTTCTPDVVTVAAHYIGPPIPVGEQYSLKDLEVHVVYTNGDDALMVSGYEVDPANRIINNIGSNVCTLIYEFKRKTFKSTFIVTGTKKLVGIRGIYDGPAVSYGQEAKRKYMIVVAEYSDGSSATVTDFTLPGGSVVSETNSGKIPIYYKGFDGVIVVPTFDLSSSRLIAFYSGPNVEVGHDFDIKYATVKIYYADSSNFNNFYEDIDSESCTFSTTMIDHEGVNYITVQYEGRLGLISTKMVVIGIKPEVKLNFIEAEYTGPEIYQDGVFSPERIICKAHYSDGSIVKVRNFRINSNIVKDVGPNEYLVTFTDKDDTAQTTVTVIGLEKDSTSENGYNEISLLNNYPEMTRLNNRYRGPAEAQKHHDVNQMLHDTLIEIHEIFAGIERSFNEFVTLREGQGNVKAKTLGTVQQISDSVNAWLMDKRFSTGYYERGEENE